MGHSWLIICVNISIGWAHMSFYSSLACSFFIPTRSTEEVGPWEYNLFYPTFPILYQALAVKKRRLHVVGLNQGLFPEANVAVAVKRSSPFLSW